MRFLPKLIIYWYVDLISPMIRFCIRHRIQPNLITVIGFATTVVAAVAFARGTMHLAGAIMLFSGTFDIIDGKVARATNRSSKFGSFFDSNMDRLSDAIVNLGLLYYYMVAGMNEMVWVLMIFTIGGMMVSYTRSKAEALNIDCKVGMFQRPERVVYLGFAGVLGPQVLYYVVWVLAIFTNLTFIQRMVHVYKVAHGVPLEEQD